MTVSTVEQSCTMLVFNDKSESLSDIKSDLELVNDPPKQADALKKVLSMLLNGEDVSSIFITIVRYVLPSEDHTIQKLLLLYLESIKKTDSNGKILPEMILICQNLRNNLIHPNEFLRGVTLRFLCRIHEEEILEPLIPSILENLEHRHSFVRRNAVLCMDSIYGLDRGATLLLDATELVEEFLEKEQDISARRNAFLMLCNHDQDRALNYLINNVDKLSSWGDVLQLAVLDLIRKVSYTMPDKRGKMMKVLLALLQSQFTSVTYESAVALIQLSKAPSAIREAANTFCQLVINHSDNNVKLIVLDRIKELKDTHRDVLQDGVMDILRALQSPSLAVKKKTLQITMDLVYKKNINEVVQMLKKEVIKTSNASEDKSNMSEYRQLLVQAIHQCARRFPDVAGDVIHLLMDFLGDTVFSASALDVIFFVRDIVETNPVLRASIIQRLVDIFSTIRLSRVCASALWIIGEYCEGNNEVSDALRILEESLGPLPLIKKDNNEEEEEEKDDVAIKSKPFIKAQRPQVLADGTYATQTNIDMPSSSACVPIDDDVPNLRALVLEGDFFIASSIAVTMTKLILRLRQKSSDECAVNRLSAQCMLYMVSFLGLGESSQFSHPLSPDCTERMKMCIHALADPSNNAVMDALTVESRQAYTAMVQEQRRKELEAEKDAKLSTCAECDDIIDFHHLKSRKDMSQLELEDSIARDVAKATGFGEGAQQSMKHNRVLQLTGFSDPIYAEAYVIVNQYDIVLDVNIMNRTGSTLQNVSLELATMGDLKLVERPQSHNLASGEVRSIRANIKVSSTETGVIFGNIVYEDSSGYSDRNVVVLNDIHIDIMDYITPASCPDVVFRNMWAEFEWENKVAVNKNISNVSEFLEHIMESTNMQCLSPPSALEGVCGFLAANLYAKSVFGEDALVNISVESQTDGKLTGYIRIRSKTQGIALSLGDKITLVLGSKWKSAKK